MAATAFSEYLQNKILNHVLRNVTYTSESANLYIGLCTATPSDASFGTEVSGNAYARVAVGTNWNAPATTGSPMTATNSTTLTFATPTPSGWGTVSHFVIANHLSNATASLNLLAWGTLGSSKTINAGDTVSFASGSISVSLD